MWQIVETVVAALLLIAAFLFRNYKKEKIKKLFPNMKALQGFFYPFIYMLLVKTRIISVFIKKSRHVEKIACLDINYPKQDACTRFLIKTGGKLLFILMVSLAFAASVDVLAVKEKELGSKNQILRPKTGEGEKEVKLLVKMKGGEREETEEINLQVEERRLDYEEYEKEVKEAEKYLDENVLGENLSVDYVDKPLKLIKKLPDSHLKLDWELGINSYIAEDGSIKDREIKEGTLIKITALLTYEDWETEYEMHFMLYPPKKTWEELAKKSLREGILRENDISSRMAFLTLPELEGSVSFYYEEPETKYNGTVLLFGISVSILLVPVVLENVGKSVKKRELQMMLDYPEIVNKFTLLLGAGLTIPMAWKRIVKEYEKKGKFRYAYEEAKRALRDMDNGTSPGEAIEDFGKRIRLVPYMKFSSLIVQNMKKGTENLLTLLEYEAAEAFRERKETAKRLGEQAGTKLLFPMIIFMGIVFGIILLPAVRGF